MMDRLYKHLNFCNSAISEHRDVFDYVGEPKKESLIECLFWEAKELSFCGIAPKITFLGIRNKHYAKTFAMSKH